MRKVSLGDGGLGISRLGFGCAPIMGRVGRRHALDAMACAFDLGVTHFDVARSYGFGDAERVVGEFIRGRRHQLTVATKFGVVPPTLSASQRLLRPWVRPLMKLAAPLRRRVHQTASGLLDAHRFDVAYARDCLETSLRALGIDRIDLYLLHEPEFDRLDGRSELARFLEDSVTAGKVRAWGFAHPSAPCAPGGDLRSGSVLQFESPVSRPAPWPLGPDERRLLIVTRPFAGGSFGDGPAANLLAPHGESAPAAIRTRSPLELAVARSLAAVGAGGAAVAGMFDRAHIRANVAAVMAYEGERVAIDAALGGGRVAPPAVGEIEGD